MNSSVTPTPNNGFRHHRNNSSKDEGKMFAFNEGLTLPSRLGKDGRSIPNASNFAPRTASLANSVAPGSFSSTMKTMTPRTVTRPDFNNYSSSNDVRADSVSLSEKRQAEFQEKIDKETKMKAGTENLLEALQTNKTNSKAIKEQRLRVESEINASDRKIADLKLQLQQEIERSKLPQTAFQTRLSSLQFASPLQPPLRASSDNEDLEYDDDDVETESPTFVLGEILQTLEVEGMQPDYYVHHANELVDLFKRYPTLKYDLAWSIFGLRIQTMLLSESREVTAAGYRVTRHAIADRKSLQMIRALHTDPLVVLSLAKDSKATIEREQALKFVRSFLDIKDGVQELSNAVVRAVISIAEHHEDRLRSIAILTLAEILIRNPSLVIRTGGILPLSEALKDGSYPGSESLVSAFLYIADMPQLRKVISTSHDLNGPFGLFSDSLSIPGHEERLKVNARSISATINSWPGLFALSYHGFANMSALLMCLTESSSITKSLVLDLLFDVLHIKPPSWTSSFLAGRRLTTYGRVAHLRDNPQEHRSRLENEDDLNRANLVDHYTALVLSVLVRCGLIEALATSTTDEEDMALNRKATLLLSEVLKLADHILPKSLSAELQPLPSVMRTSHTNDHSIASSQAIQIDTVSRTLHRTAVAAKTRHKQSPAKKGSSPTRQMEEAAKPKLSVDMDDIQFRSLIVDTQVVSSANYLKWKWDLINDIIEGPLQNPKRLEDAKSTKFMKRLVGFYRPFKYRFSDASNTKPNQRYVRTGCALIKCLLKTAEGIQYLAENKLLRQLAECLAQLDPMSGITSSAPLFATDKVASTLVGGYFKILGALSSEPQGLVMIARWRMINMFYHILDLKDRDDIVHLLLGSMDFTLESHLRVMLSKALTSGQKTIRIFATKLLRKYATREITNETSNSTLSVAYWAIRLLITQLYDPDVEVSEVAVQILQEACNRKQYLEYVVKCRPALDHLGEIGAPLLLRFLSTSLGYQYLHGLDYITQEMDDWFLGRNERYVTLVEASLSRAFSYEPERPKTSTDEPPERQLYGIVPPHFYRELTRTQEGCQLLQESGHFEEFVSTIKDFWAEDNDSETMLKVKGCLWAVGNVGSMEFGAPLLEKSNVVEWIIKIVEHSGVMTMRGTAFFVLGLISRSLHGMEILTEQGWDAAVDHNGRSLGYVLPPTLNILFPIEPQYNKPLPPPLASLSDMPAGLDEDDPLENRIYSSVIESGNTVLSLRALNNLNSIRSKKPHLFNSIPVFQKILYILECHTVRLPVRQRIIDMFDKDVMRQIVLEETTSDDEMEESQPNTARPPVTARLSNLSR